MLLRSYKMTHLDSPYIKDDVLSVATCLGSLRKNWQVGEWIAGFSSLSLDKSKQGQEKLIYIAKVNKKLSLKEYWQQYPQRRLDKNKNGDNLYEFVSSEYVRVDEKGQRYKIHSSDKKDEWHRKNIKADCVLVCNEFYYFGKANMQILPMRKDIKVARVGAKTEGKNVEKLLQFVRANKDKCVNLKNDKGKVGTNGIITQQGCGSRHLSKEVSDNKVGSCSASQNNASKKC